MVEKRIAVDLETILDSREKRLQKQQVLLNNYQSTLISFMVNMPSMYKSTPLSQAIHKEGDLVLTMTLDHSGMKILACHIDDEPTGREGFYVVQGDGSKVKALTVELEENHDLGRFWDLDVFDAAGTLLTRNQQGLNTRRCFICNDDAKVCARSRRHTYEELIEHIQESYSNYMKKNGFKATTL